MTEAGPHEDCYQPDPAGGFVLSEAAVSYIARCRTELEQVERDARQAAPTRMLRSRAAIASSSNCWSKKALRESLKRERLRPELQAAMAVLQSQHENTVIETSEGFEVRIETKFGARTVDQIVGPWMILSEQVARSRSGPATSEDFVGQLRQLH